MSDTRPIGIFDSGLGGLTVVKELHRLLPGERVLYLGDSARYPYGNRSEETIRRFGIEDARFLQARDIKMLVVACNTVSSVALEFIRGHVSDIPVIGVVLPGARAAVSRTAEKKVGVVGTHATIRTGAYVEAIRRLDSHIKVYVKACPLFVPLVEEGMLDSDITRLVAQHYLYELVDTGIDCLILGCTHYPLLMEVVQATVGARIQVLDSALWAAREAQEILVDMGAQSGAADGGFENSEFFTSDKPQRFGEQAARFLGREMPRVTTVSLDELAMQA